MQQKLKFSADAVPYWISIPKFIGTVTFLLLGAQYDGRVAWASNQNV
jgi:hypothetical protein